MGGLSRTIDPVTRDYVDDGLGGDVETRTLATDAGIALRMHLGGWWGQPDNGSLIYASEQAVASPDEVRNVVDAVKRALQRFVDDKRASDLAVSSSVDQYGRAAITASMRDLQTGSELALALRPLRS
jgi:hypothetical protein